MSLPPLHQLRSPQLILALFRLTNHVSSLPFFLVPETNTLPDESLKGGYRAAPCQNLTTFQQESSPKITLLSLKLSVFLTQCKLIRYPKLLGHQASPSLSLAASSKLIQTR